MSSNVKPFQVLCIEDSAPDIELLRFLFSHCELPTELHFVGDVMAGSDFLLKKSPHEKAPTPDLIILDLNMPGKNGRTLIRELKSHSDLCQIPVVMLSTSSSDKEISDCYCRGASAFITKPTDVKKFQNLIKKLVDFYFDCIALPTRLGK